MISARSDSVRGAAFGRAGLRLVATARQSSPATGKVTQRPLRGRPVLRSFRMSAYHFISGLPRAGSTLLAALLRQNPAVAAGISSPLGPLFHATRNAMGAWTETSVLLQDAQRERILRGLFDSYYADQQDRRLILDTNRAWCARLPAL